MIAKAQYGDIKFADCYNVGPDECDCITTGELVDLFVKYAGNINRIDKSEKDAVHEANFLKLDCSKLKTVLAGNLIGMLMMQLKNGRMVMLLYGKRQCKRLYG